MNIISNILARIILAIGCILLAIFTLIFGPKWLIETMIDIVKEWKYGK